MSVIDSINQAREKGASDDMIMAEIIKQNPQKAAVFQQASKAGASSQEILNEVVKQNTVVTPPDAREVADLKSAQTYGASFPYESNAGEANIPKAIGNVPSSFINFISNLGSAIVHPIRTVKGLGSTAIGAGETLGNLIKTGKATSANPDVHEQAFSNLVGALQDRYGSLENLTRTSVNDPVGLGADIFTILSGGAALADTVSGTSKLNKATQAARAVATPAEAAEIPKLAGATGALDRGVSTVASPVIRAGEATIKGAGKLASQILGAETGSGASSVKTGYQAGREGSDVFAKAMRGKVDADEVVQSAQDAVSNIVEQRRSNYLQDMASMKQVKKSLDISPVTNELDKQLKNFGVGIADDGSLDFSRSSIANNGTARADIQGVYDTLKTWGTKPGDRTVVGLDTLKKQLGDFYSPSGSARAFVQGVKSKVSTILHTQVPGYTKMTEGYQAASNLLDEIKSAVGAGGKAKVDTVFSKLTSAMKQDNQLRLEILDQMTNLGKQPDLLEKIAGLNMQGYIPKSLVGKGIDITTAFTILKGAFNVHYLPLLFSTSPRIVGEFVHGLGIGARKADLILRAVERVTKSGLILLPASQAGRIPGATEPATAPATQ